MKTHFFFKEKGGGERTVITTVTNLIEFFPYLQHCPRPVVLSFMRPNDLGGILLVSDLQRRHWARELPSLPIVVCLASGGARIGSQTDRHQASALDHGRRDYFYTGYERKTKSLLKTCECTER